VKQSRFFFAAAVLAALLGLPAHAADVAFSIRYFDKRIYHLASDPIMVEVTLTNNSPASYRFKLADDRAFSLDFNVRTTTNRPVPAADSLLRKRATGGHVYFREVSIGQGESFSFIEDLRNYAAFSAGGSYVVRAKIYPGLYRDVPDSVEAAGIEAEAALEAALESNQLNLVLRPPTLPGIEGVEEAIDEETREILVREKLAPDEVVEYTLQARQRSQWTKFFLYLDLEALLSRDQPRQRQWRSESEEGRRRMVANYKEELRRPALDQGIASSPSEFTILRTEYSGSEGTVTVREKFHRTGYTEVKRFAYTLRRNDNIWTIVDYEVTNMGTE